MRTTGASGVSTRERNRMNRRTYVIALLILLAPAFADAQVSNQGCTHGSGTTTSLPPGIVENDLLYLCASCSSRQSALTGFSNITNETGTYTNSNSAIDSRYRVATGSDSAPTLTGSFCSWAICDYRGANVSGTIFDTLDGSHPRLGSSTNSGTSVVGPQVTTTVNSDWYIDCSSLTSAFTNGSSALLHIS